MSAIGAQTAKPVANANMSAPVLSPELQKVKAALDKYQDPVLAVHDARWAAWNIPEAAARAA